MLSVILLSVIMLSVIMLSVIKLSVIKLSVIMLSVGAPLNTSINIHLGSGRYQAPALQNLFCH
jgi:hypothetical protein